MPKDYRTPRLPLRGLMVGAGCSIRAPLTAWPKVRGCQRCCSRTHRWPIRSCFFAPGVGMTCRRRWWLSPPARGSKIAGGLSIYDRRQSRKSQHASPPDAHGRVALQAPSSGAAPDEKQAPRVSHEAGAGRKAQPMFFAVRLERGGPWDWSRDLRELAGWDEHAHLWTLS
jgi:hypothetical protein